jgi:hypothetical protein
MLTKQVKVRSTWLSHLYTGNAIDRLHKLLPTVALRFQYFLSVGSDSVVTAPALPWLFDPATLDPPALLQSTKQRIQRADTEAKISTRTLFDQLANVVSMTWLILNERQNQQFGTSFL